MAQRSRKKCSTLCLLIAIPLVFFATSPVLLQKSPIFTTTADTKCHTTTVDAPRFNDLDNQYVVWPTAPVNHSNVPAWTKFKATLEAYSHFHQHGIEKLQGGHQSPAVRTLTWACSQNSCAGLGDQLLRLQMFFLLAVISDRVFTVYWDDNLKESTKYLGHNEIDWRFFDKNLGMCSDANMACSDRIYTIKSVFGFAWNKEEVAQFGDILFGPTQHITVTGLVYASLTIFTDEEWLKSASTINSGLEKIGVKEILSFEGEAAFTAAHSSLWYSLLHTFGIHRLMEVPEANNGRIKVTTPLLFLGHTIFCYLFKISKRVAEEAAQMSTALGLQPQQYMSVHLRTGFKGTVYEESIATRWLHRNWKIFDDEDVWACIMDYSLKLADHRIGAGSPVYLSTDSDLVRKWAVNKYSPRVRMAEGMATHSAHSKTTCDNAQTSLWTDLFILSNAHTIVHGVSSFATIATLLFPTELVRQPLIMYDEEQGCIASHVGKSVSCIC